MKQSISKYLAAVAAIGFALSGISCKPKAGNNPPTPLNAIVGKWSQGNNSIMIFTPDGSAVCEQNGTTNTGQYSITNGNILRLKMPDVSTAVGTVEFDVAFSSDKEMFLTMHIPKNLPAEQLRSDLGTKRFTRLPN